MKPEWLDGLPQDISIMLRLSENGWINKQSFMAWGETSLSQLPKDSSLSQLLFKDRRGSHIYNMELIKENNVHVWCLPAHTTHWLQPADRSLFRSLKHYWTEGSKCSRINASSISRIRIKVDEENYNDVSDYVLYDAAADSKHQ